MLVVTAGFAELAPAVGVVVVGAFTVVVASAVVAAVGEVMPPDVGVPVDAEAGKLVSGVGSGGNGLDNTLAINSGIPASTPLCRNLYQVLRSSIHCFF